MADQAPRLLVLGAHPDDAEFHAGGLIVRYSKRGHPVKVVSVTNGCSGHHVYRGAELVAMRKRETAAVAELLGIEYEVWDNPDGGLLPTLEVRHQVIREIRSFQPDLVLTHRTCDYHPDHRAVGQAVQDASYLVTVPPVVSDVTALRRDPVVAYMTDFFTKPVPFSPDVVLDTAHEFETVLDILACHVSQVFEWLPYNGRVEADVPEGNEERRKWLAGWFGKRSGAVADRFREALCTQFGAEQGNAVQHAEAYEISEYAGDMDATQREWLFP